MYMVEVKRDLKGKTITSRLGPFQNRETAEQAVLKAYDLHGIFLIEAKIIEVNADA